METIAKVRRASRVGGKSIRSIARTMNMSRNTVRKVPRSQETEHRYRRGVWPKPKLGGYVAALEEMLEANEKRDRKDRLTAKRIWFDLAGRGCGAGYNVVCRHAAQWRRGRGTGTGGAYVPLEFDPGEAYQFDWSREHVVIAGATTKLKVAHLRLCHSRMSFARAYPRETREMVFDAHDLAFEPFGGSCRRGICDNTGTAVDVISAGRERRFNRRFERMCSHHLVTSEACNPRSGWEKGRVKRQRHGQHLPVWDAAVVVFPGELGDRQAPLVVDDGRLWPGTAKRRTLVEQELQVIGRFGVRLHRVGGVHQRRQADQGGNARVADVLVEALLAFAPVAQGTDPRQVADRQQIVDFRQGPLHTGLAQGALDQLLPPKRSGAVSRSTPGSADFSDLVYTRRASSGRLAGSRAMASGRSSHSSA